MTRLGVMQPYFFPHPGHFALIAHTDEWVVFDTSQYTPKRWMNRNRVLRDDTGWWWLSVPVSHTGRPPSCEVLLEDLDGGRRRIMGRLRHYQGRAPHATAVTELVESVLADPGDGTLVDLDIRGLAAICRYVGLDFRARRLSQMSLTLPPVDHPGGWAPAISAAVGADQYLNPIGGQDLFDGSEFTRNDVELLFCDVPVLHYDTCPYGYEPNLSIIDALMWCSPDQVLDHLHLARALPADSVQAAI